MQYVVNIAKSVAKCLCLAYVRDDNEIQLSMRCELSFQRLDLLFLPHTHADLETSFQAVLQDITPDKACGACEEDTCGSHFGQVVWCVMYRTSGSASAIVFAKAKSMAEDQDGINTFGLHVAYM